MCTFVCPIPHAIAYPMWNTSCTCIFTPCINALRAEPRDREVQLGPPPPQRQIAAWDPHSTHTSLHSNVSLWSNGGQQPFWITLMCTQGWGLNPQNYTIQLIQSAPLSIVTQIKEILFGRNNDEVVLQIRIIGQGGRWSKSKGWWNMIRCATSPSFCSSVDVCSCNGFNGGVCFGPDQVFLCVRSACIIASSPQAVLTSHYWAQLWSCGNNEKCALLESPGLSSCWLGHTHTAIHAEDMHKCIMQRRRLARASLWVMGGVLLTLSSVPSRCFCLKYISVSSYGYKQLRLSPNCTLASSLSC